MRTIGTKIPKMIDSYDFSEENSSFSYLTKASAVYSSNIEGNSVDLNSFMNYQINKDKFKTGKEIEEIEDLIQSYEFAQGRKLNEGNVLKCHEMLSQTLLIDSKRGNYRL
ncbi:MAG: Fic family protein, partial [Bacteroidetes bacterium]|nr:Fic family protein [Bacteroidota bacterium]